MYCRYMANKEDNYICTTTYIQLLDLSSGISHKILKLFSTEKNREFPTFTCIKSFSHWMASSSLQLLKPDSAKLLLTHFLFLLSTWNPSGNTVNSTPKTYHKSIYPIFAATALFKHQNHLSFGLFQ